MKAVPSGRLSSQGERVMTESRAARDGRKSKGRHLLGLFLLLALIATACGNDGSIDDASDAAAADDEVSEIAFADDAPTRENLPGCVAPPQNMTHWWTFDGPTWHEQLSGAAGLEAVAQAGNATSVTGLVHEAVSFEGDHLVVSDGLQLGTGDFSMDAWVNMRRGTSGPVILDSRGEEGSGLPGVLFTVASGDLNLQIYEQNGSWQNNISVVPVPTNGWVLVGASVERSGDVRLTINGQSVGVFSADFPNLNLDSDTLRFGRDHFLDTNTRGTVDEVEIFDRALFDDEFAAIFAAGPNGKCNEVAECQVQAAAIPEEIVAWWPFDSELSQSAEISQYTDSAPFDYNSHAMVADLRGAQIEDNGQVSGALDVRGDNTYATASLRTDAMDFGDSTDFSVDMWVRWDNSEGELRLSGDPIPNTNSELPLEERVNTFMQFTQPDEGEEAGQLTEQELGLLLDQTARAEDIRDAQLEGGEIPLPAPLPAGAFDDAPDGHVLIEHGFAEGDGWALWFDPVDDLLYFSRSWQENGVVRYQPEGSTEIDLDDGKWHLVAMAVDRTVGVDPAGTDTDPSVGRFWVDGNELGDVSNPIGRSFTNTADVGIGAVVANGQAFSEWPGFIDEVEIFQTEITDDFVTQLFEAGRGGKCKPEIVTQSTCFAELRLDWNSVTSDALAENFGIELWKTGDPVPQTLTIPTSGTGNPVQAQFGSTSQSDSHFEVFSLVGQPGDTWNVRVVAEWFETLGVYDWTLSGITDRVDDLASGGTNSTKGTIGPWSETYTDGATGDADKWPSATEAYEFGCEIGSGTDNFVGTCVVNSPAPHNPGSSVEVELIAPDAPAGTLFSYWFDEPGAANPAPLQAKTFAHTYSQAGTYQVTISWDQPDGSQDSATCQVDVVEVGEIACANIAKPSGTPWFVGDTVTFEMAPLTSGDWTFHNGTQQTNQTTGVFTYDAPGAYNVVFEANGESYECSVTIEDGETCSNDVRVTDPNGDADGDGIRNRADDRPCTPDDVTCVVDQLLETDPNGDEDNDGISNIDEFEIGTDPCTPNPCSIELADALPSDDFDGDGIPNGQELESGTDPCTRDEFVPPCGVLLLVESDPSGDFDGDGIPNARDINPCDPQDP